MKSNDSQLQQMFVRATDEIIPPAPWLEDQIAGALQQRKRARRQPIASGAFGGFGSGLRLAAAVAALAIAIATIAALLMSARLIHSPIQPGGKSPVAETPAQSQIVPFTPSPPVRASNWPPGGPVPAQLTGAWQPPLNSEMQGSGLVGLHSPSWREYVPGRRRVPGRHDEQRDHRSSFVRKRRRQWF
jgi:hypothetical protein